MVLKVIYIYKKRFKIWTTDKRHSAVHNHPFWISNQLVTAQSPGKLCAKGGGVGAGIVGGLSCVKRMDLRNNHWYTSDTPGWLLFFVQLQRISLVFQGFVDVFCDVVFFWCFLKTFFSFPSTARFLASLWMALAPKLQVTWPTSERGNFTQ